MLETYQLGNSVQKSQIVFYLGVLLDFTLENFDQSVFFLKKDMFLFKYTAQEQN